MKWMNRLLVMLLLGIAAMPVVKAAADDPVTLTEDDNSYTLANGLVKAKVDKRSGRLLSLVYNDIETLNTGYWSHSPSGNVTNSVTIDPKTNNGARAEVSVKSDSGGSQQGSGPGGGTVCDIEIRYALDKGVSGLYTYSIFTHKADYPDTSIGEARFAVKLNDHVYDWMTVDANRNMKMITASDWDHGIVQNMKEARLMTTGIDQGQVEHKYDYSANQFSVLAWGWSSSDKQVGFWFVNPTDEYLSGGPTKMELSAQRARAADVAELLARQPLWRQQLRHLAWRRMDQGHRALPDLLQFGPGSRRAVAGRPGPGEERSCGVAV